jgi:pimeloyl-ACP methyl ester carboxylesterase
MGYSFSWRFNIADLASIRTVYAPDLVGTGYSARPNALDCSCRACAERVFEFLDQESIGSVDLVGTSHGGGVAVMMAATRPERIKRLVLVAPVNPWSKHGLWITKILATRFGRFGFEKLTPALEAMSQTWVNRLYGDPKRISPGTVEGYRAPASLPGSWSYGLDIIKHWHSDLLQLADDYTRITQPTLLMWGDKDVAVYSSSAKEVKRRIPHAELKMFAGVGHLPYEEVPEEFNRTLLEFLQ